MTLSCQLRSGANCCLRSTRFVNLSNLSSSGKNAKNTLLRHHRRELRALQPSPKQLYRDGAGDSPVLSWLCTRWRQVAGTGAGRRCRAGAGAVSWLRTRWRQVAGAGAGCRCWRWCCELVVRVVETGCWCRCWCWVPGAGAGAVSWLCAWWRQVACRVPGAGCRCWCWCCELAAHAPALALFL